MSNLPAPSCEKCSSETTLRQTIARLGEVPDVYLYECKSCGAINYRHVVNGELRPWP